MNYKTILLCPTSNKGQMRRYQIYEKHFSTDPYNFLFVYVFELLSVLAFCRRMSFILYKGYHCIQENDKKSVTQFSNHFLEVTMFMVALSRLKHYDEILLVLFCSYACLDNYQERYLYCTRPYFIAHHTREINEQKPISAKPFSFLLR